MTYSTSHAAHIAKGVLSDHGIRCVIDGDQIMDMLSVYGPAVAAVNVTVAASEAEAALEILEQVNLTRPDHRGPWADAPVGWLCDHCEEPNESTFDECWSCSAVKPQNPRMANLWEPDNSVEFEARGSSQSHPIQASDSPYRTPNSDSVAAVSRASLDLNDRVFRAAVFSLFFPPFAVYAIYLAAKSTIAGTPDGRVWLVWGISLMATLAGVVVFLGG